MMDAGRQREEDKKRARSGPRGWFTRLPGTPDYCTRTLVSHCHAGSVSLGWDILVLIGTCWTGYTIGLGSDNTAVPLPTKLQAQIQVD